MDAKLIMFKRDGQRKDFTLRGKSTVIGRGEDCALRVPLLAVSRRHCELIKGDNEVRVRDLASSNGTYVNNKRINETVLGPGDRLSVGPIVLTLQVDGKPAQISPVKSKGPATPKAAAEEDVIELEADETAPATESDPIAALEALASQHTKKKPKA